MTDQHKQGNVCSFCSIEGGGHAPSCVMYVPVDPAHENVNRLITEGWTCPRCNRIYSPITGECNHCNDKIPKNANA